MTRKIIVIGIFIYSTLTALSQTKTSLECLNREFHVITHVVTDSFFIPAATQSQVQWVLDSMNKVWAPICVKFNLCEFRLDSNYNFSDWNKDIMEDEYIALNQQPRNINIVVVNKIIRPLGLSGHSVYEGVTRRAKCLIVVVGADKPNVWIQQMGTYFGLKGPYAAPLANANNQNCQTLDDELCDTPPDPDSTGASQSNCIYNGSFQDANGKYFNPFVENFMSNYSNCGRSFTHMQYERMITTYRKDTEAKF